MSKPTIVRKDVLNFKLYRLGFSCLDMTGGGMKSSLVLWLLQLGFVSLVGWAVCLRTKREGLSPFRHYWESLVFSSRSDQTLDWVLLLSNLSLHWKGIVKIKRPVIKTIMADLNNECMIVYDIWSESVSLRVQSPTVSSQQSPLCPVFQFQ